MPSTRNKRSISSSKSSKKAKGVVAASSSFDRRHTVFFPLLAVTFIVWVLYRALFRFPVVFDETIGKAIFFGLPVWLYVTMTNSKSIVDTLAPEKLKKGLLLGLAVGGLYGFAMTLFQLWGPNVTVSPVAYFTSSNFWWEFMLAIFTSFWETLFFFSWIMVVIQEKYKHWSLGQQVLVVAAIFTVFHIPNALLRFDLSSILTFVMIMFMFAVGQSLLFAYRRNAYALILSQALWGMVLLLHY